MNMNRKINKVTILGSGVMGSRIACHFANIGVEVLLLDIVPKDASADKRSRNKIVNDALQKISACDWIIEVVIERLDIKMQVFEKVEKFRKPGTLITSNTSGIPIHMMAEGRSDDFKKHFCGTHFSNPPRYLRLLEIIPTPFTDSEVTDFLMHFGDLYLGKTTVLCKDTPAFIANRIGVFGIMSIMNAMDKLQLNVDEIDA